MAIPSVGSNSLDNRRRRRLAVTGEGVPIEDDLLDGVSASGRVISELVGSEAAAPWVPADEWRIWTYGAMLGLLLIAVSFALTHPTAFRPELAPLTKHLLQGDRPVLGAVVQASLWFLCAQLAVLIAWYRIQCKLDFGGRYWVWPWAAAAFGVMAFCSLTNAHGLFGEIISQLHWLSWRGDVLAWLFPAGVAAVPLMFLLDRDVRRGRSTVWTLRTAGLLGLVTGGLELFSPDLLSQSWYPATRLIVPLFAAGTLFLGLWLHARVVAYVCPDPPECDEPKAGSQLLGAARWCFQLTSRCFGWMSRFFVRRAKSAEIDEAEAKPKRRSRKVAETEETPKRKRKPAAKRVTKPRTRVEVVEEEEEEGEEQHEEIEDESYEDASEGADSYESEVEPSSSHDSDENEWDEADEEEVETPRPSGRSAKSASTSTASFSASQKKPAAESWQQQRPASQGRTTQPPVTNQSESSDEEEDSDESDPSYRLDDGLTPDQLRGLSKRQKRDLRQKMKDPQRTPKR